MTLVPAIDSGAGILAAWALAGYLMGSVPFGLALARLMGLGDLRSIGSGNIGATNVLRTGSKTAAAATLLLDAAKGGAAVLLARWAAGEDAAQAAALAALLGHCHPVWLGFRGGKGVAPFLGLSLALAWPVGLAACLTWLVVAVAARMSSLSSLSAALLAPLWAALLGHTQMIALAAVLAAVILWRHRANIRRLLDGTEPKIGRG